MSLGNPKTQKEIWKRLNRHFGISHQSQLPAIHYIDAMKCLQKMVFTPQTQISLLPIPFQTGQFLVTCTEEGFIKIQDASKYKFVDIDSLDKFEKEIATMCLEVSEFISRLSYLKKHLTLKDSQLPSIAMLQQGQTFLDKYKTNS